MLSQSQKEAKRKKSLGELGELFAIKSLVDRCYDRVRNLNDSTPNEKYADILCEKNGEKIVISVKSRNKYQKNGKLNSSYKLGNNCYLKAQEVEEKYNAKAYWMAIQFDSNSYSIYFGSLESLENRNAIPVGKCEKGEIGKIWESDTKHYFDFDFYSNK